MRPKCLILFLAMLLPGQESTDLLDAPGWLSRGSQAYKSGQLQSAAEAFQKAVELNPHSGLINKQLVLFQDALAKKRAEMK